MVVSHIMKQYVVDEIRSEDYMQIKAFLDKAYGESDLGGLYWIPVDEALLTPIQSCHRLCQPFYVALDLEPGRLSCELLIRTKERLRCDCMAYATEEQRNWIINSIDRVFNQLEIIA